MDFDSIIIAKGQGLKHQGVLTFQDENGNQVKFTLENMLAKEFLNLISSKIEDVYDARISEIS